MYIKRNLEDKIIKYLETPEIIAVVGPRQCGKTKCAAYLSDSIFKVYILFIIFIICFKMA